MLLLQANITNEDVTEHSFIFQVQVKNEAGVIVALAGSGGTIAAGGSMTPYVSWIPETAGTYTIEVCIWKSLSEPEPLSRALFDRKRTPVALLLAILAIAILLPAAAAQAITVETNKDVYVPGDALIVSGTAPPNAAVSIQVYNPAGSQCGIGQNTSDAQGNYMVTVFTFPSEPTTSFPLGNYTVKAYSGGNTAEKTIQFASQAPPPPPTSGPIAVAIDVGAIYSPGETAAFHILTTISGVPATVTGITSNLYLPDGTKVPVSPSRLT